MAAKDGKRTQRQRVVKTINFDERLDLDKPIEVTELVIFGRKHQVTDPDSAIGTMRVMEAFGKVAQQVGIDAGDGDFDLIALAASGGFESLFDLIFALVPSLKKQRKELEMLTMDQLLELMTDVGVMDVLSSKNEKGTEGEGAEDGEEDSEPQSLEQVIEGKS